MARRVTPTCSAAVVATEPGGKAEPDGPVGPNANETEPEEPEGELAQADTTAEATENTGEEETTKEPATPAPQGGFGPNTGLPAPQGGALAGIIESLSSEEGVETIPVDKYAMGGAVGLLLGAAPMAGLGVLVGLAMYLPFYITLGYGCGCLLQMLIQRVKGLAFCEHRLVPVAAGLIVGEALTGMGHALYSVMAGG